MAYEILEMEKIQYDENRILTQHLRKIQCDDLYRTGITVSEEYEAIMNK
jgi:hypothetical protein